MAPTTAPKAPIASYTEDLDGQMSWLIQRGCSFYHAGLTTTERQAIEAAFRAGVISVLTTVGIALRACTSILAHTSAAAMH